MRGRILRYDTKYYIIKCIVYYYVVKEYFCRIVLFERDLDWRWRAWRFTLKELRRRDKLRKKLRQKRIDTFTASGKSIHIGDEISNLFLLRLFVCILLTSISVFIKTYISFDMSVYFYWCVCVACIFFLIFFWLKNDVKKYENILIILVWSFFSAIHIVGWGIPYLDVLLGFSATIVEKRLFLRLRLLEKHHLSHMHAGRAWYLINYFLKVISHWYYYYKKFISVGVKEIKSVWDEIVDNFKFDAERIVNTRPIRIETLKEVNDARMKSWFRAFYGEHSKRYLTRKGFRKRARRVAEGRAAVLFYGIWKKKYFKFNNIVKSLEFLLKIDKYDNNKKIYDLEKYFKDNKDFFEENGYTDIKDISKLRIGWLKRRRWGKLLKKYKGKLEKLEPGMKLMAELNRKAYEKYAKVRLKHTERWRVEKMEEETYFGRRLWWASKKKKD